MCKCIRLLHFVCAAPLPIKVRMFRTPISCELPWKGAGMVGKEKFKWVTDSTQLAHFRPLRQTTQKLVIYSFEN